MPAKLSDSKVQLSVAPSRAYEVNGTSVIAEKFRLTVIITAYRSTILPCRSAKKMAGIRPA